MTNIPKPNTLIAYGQTHSRTCDASGIGGGDACREHFRWSNANVSLWGVTGNTLCVWTMVYG